MKAVARMVEPLDSAKQAAFYQAVSDFLGELAHHRQEGARWEEILGGPTLPPAPEPEDEGGQGASALETKLLRFLSGTGGKRPSVAGASMAVIAVDGSMDTRAIDSALKARGFSVSGGKDQIRSSLFGPRKKGRLRFRKGKYCFPGADAKDAYLAGVTG